MRNRGIVAALAVIVATMAWGSSALHAATLEKGTIELTPSLGFNRNSLSVSGTDVGTLTNFSASGEIGYCVTNHFEVGGGLLMTYQSIDDPISGSESSTAFGVIGGVQYNFSSAGQMVPFARAAIGILTNSGSLSVGEETSFIAPMLQAGIRLLVGTSASVNCGIGYRHQTNTFGAQDLSANTFELQVGVSIFPRRGM